MMPRHKKADLVFSHTSHMSTFMKIKLASPVQWAQSLTENAALQAKTNDITASVRGCYQRLAEVCRPSCATCSWASSPVNNAHHVPTWLIVWISKVKPTFYFCLCTDRITFTPTHTHTHTHTLALSAAALFTWNRDTLSSFCTFCFFFFPPPTCITAGRAVKKKQNKTHTHTGLFSVNLSPTLLDAGLTPDRQYYIFTVVLPLQILTERWLHRKRKHVSCCSTVSSHLLVRQVGRAAEPWQRDIKMSNYLQ